MGSTLGSYEIARSGMYVHERSLTVTGHNISNATTPGYVRQQAIISNSNYITTGGGFQVGEGAQIQQTRQIRHTFLDAIYRRENTALGYWETRSSDINDIETILGDPSMVGVDGDMNIQGVQNVMNQFWDSWQELAKDPSSLTMRSMLAQRAGTLVDQFNHIGEQLDNMQYHLNDEIKVRVDEVNDITGKIAKLNTQIMYNEINGDHANDLRDERNVLVDRLTKLADVETQDMSGGWVYVTLGGNVLVNKGVNTELYTDKSNTYAPFYDIKLGGTTDKVQISSGIIKGLLDSRGSDFYCEGDAAASAANPTDIKTMSVADVKKLLNTMVMSIADSLNTLHQNGADLRGNAGVPFFVKKDTSLEFGIGNIELNSLISNDVNLIAASSSTNPAVGNSENASEIAGIRLKDTLGPAGQEVNCNEYYNRLILALGSNGQEAVNNTTSQTTLVQSADNARKAITDVSMDEELSSMMKFQYSYDAASRVLNVIDEMVKTVITQMGLVGR